MLWLEWESSNVNSAVRFPAELCLSVCNHNLLLQRNTELVILHLNIDTAFCVRAASAQRAYTPTATVSHAALNCCAYLPFIFSEYVYIQYMLISLCRSCLGGTPTLTAEWNILNTRFSCFVRSFWLYLTANFKGQILQGKELIIIWPKYRNLISFIWWKKL